MRVASVDMTWEEEANYLPGSIPITHSHSPCDLQFSHKQKQCVTCVETRQCQTQWKPPCRSDSFYTCLVCFDLHCMFTLPSSWQTSQPMADKLKQTVDHSWWVRNRQSGSSRPAHGQNSGQSHISWQPKCHRRTDHQTNIGGQRRTLGRFHISHSESLHGQNENQ